MRIPKSTNECYLIANLKEAMTKSTFVVESEKYSKYLVSFLKISEVLSFERSLCYFVYMQVKADDSHSI